MKKIIVFILITISILILIFLTTTKKDSKESTTNYYQNEIKTNELQNDILKQNEKFIYFYQTNCHYCKKTSPIVIPMTKKLNINMEVLNLEKEPNGWNQFKIEGTPTIIHYKNGKEIDRIEGEYKKEEFKEWFNKNKK
ncbi:thioredoxin domain-containing protein [Bacillus sp. FSL R12-0074]|uniref:thioredoxin domain-containing protein n=1 Tax=Bacillus sp. FSL R12-0074 TaxID=2954664 RepID=UPI000D2FCEB8